MVSFCSPHHRVSDYIKDPARSIYILYSEIAILGYITTIVPAKRRPWETLSPRVKDQNANR
jgi:hypothetical protein